MSSAERTTFMYVLKAFVEAADERSNPASWIKYHCPKGANWSPHYTAAGRGVFCKHCREVMECSGRKCPCNEHGSEQALDIARYAVNAYFKGEKEHTNGA